MANYFGEIAFGEASKVMQEKVCSRASYARAEKVSFWDGLTHNESSFIAERDSFYMASITESGFPYVQHRGGPKGFLKVLDSKRLGFIDFKGNMQFISIGNFETNNHVSLFLMDYPNKARLKIFAKAEVVELKNEQGLYDLLDLKDYKFRPERMIILHIEAYDWNCSQHITPRFEVEEIEELLSPQREYIAQLEAKIKELEHKKAASVS